MDRIEEEMAQCSHGLFVEGMCPECIAENEPKPSGRLLTDINPYANVPTQDGLDTCYIAWNKGFERAIALKAIHKGEEDETNK